MTNARAGDALPGACGLLANTVPAKPLDLLLRHLRVDTVESARVPLPAQD